MRSRSTFNLPSIIVKALYNTWNAAKKNRRMCIWCNPVIEIIGSYPCLPKTKWLFLGLLAWDKNSPTNTEWVQTFLQVIPVDTASILRGWLVTAVHNNLRRPVEASDWPSALHGSIVSAIVEEIHTLRIYVWKKVRRRDMNPRTINSAIQHNHQTINYKLLEFMKLLKKEKCFLKSADQFWPSPELHKELSCASLSSTVPKRKV